MLKAKIVVICGIVVILCGCAHTIYTYGRAKYASSEAALKAQQDDISRMIAEISPTDNSLGGRALVVLPSQRLIEEKGIKTTGHVKRDDIEYVISTIKVGQDAMAEMLKRRKIFEEVSITRSDQPETVTSSGYDIVIYLLVSGPNQKQWFLRTSSNDESIAIYMDQSLPVGAQRALSWLDYIEKIAGEAGGEKKG